MYGTNAYGSAPYGGSSPVTIVGKIIRKGMTILKTVVNRVTLRTKRLHVTVLTSKK